VAKAIRIVLQAGLAVKEHAGVRRIARYCRAFVHAAKAVRRSMVLQYGIAVLRNG
jgi:hypothetical protein